MVNSPKDYLTDRVAEFRKRFVETKGVRGNPYNNETEFMRFMRQDPNVIEAFLTETIQQSMEVGKKKKKTTKDDVRKWLFENDRELYWEFINRNKKI